MCLKKSAYRYLAFSELAGGNIKMNKIHILSSKGWYRGGRIQGISSYNYLLCFILIVYPR